MNLPADKVFLFDENGKTIKNKADSFVGGIK
jgi:hypothetical protein